MSDDKIIQDRRHTPRIIALRKLVVTHPTNQATSSGHDAIRAAGRLHDHTNKSHANLEKPLDKGIQHPILLFRIPALRQITQQACDIPQLARATICHIESET
jgi:hypothetical protein